MVRLSIVVVAYRNMECLAACLASIPVLPWIEVIVVNNTHQNRGFSTGCNSGAQLASGEHLLFLNPDCIVDEKALVRLVQILDEDKTIGIVGPKLTDVDGKAYLSCNRPLSRLASPFVYSFLNRILNKLPLVRNYWFGYKPPVASVEVGSVCGAAMGMRRRVFEQVNGFDERFFLYWEEFDLALRVSASGYRIVFDPSMTIVHEGELSTTQPKLQVLRWFRESRYYFFSKHFGTVYAVLLEGWLTFSEEWRYLAGVLGVLGFGLWFYQYGWWLGLGYLSFWQGWLYLGLPTVSIGFWFGVAGALFLMTMVYNELKISSRWVLSLLSLLVGIWAVFVSIAGPFLVFFGGLWVIADLQKRLLSLRKGLVMVSLLSLFVMTVFLVRNTLLRQGYVGSLPQWSNVARLINKSGRPVSIRCVGCRSDQELTPLVWLLSDRGIHVSSTASEMVYLFLPPYSSSKNLLPDSMIIRVGNIVIAWPLAAI